MNDTTSSALKAEKLIVDCNDPGYFGIQQCELIFKHGTGHVVRKVQGVVQDPFVDCGNLRKSAKDFVSWITNKKIKSRWKQYADWCKQ